MLSVAGLNGFDRSVYIAVFVLLALVMSTGLAGACDDISSPVFDEADNFSSWPPGSGWELNGLNFGGFFYDIHDDVHGESITIYKNGTSGQRTLNTSPQNSLVYRSSVFYLEPEFAFVQQDDPAGYLTYPLIGIAGEPYTPLTEGCLSSLSGLLVDDDGSYVLEYGDTLGLGEGYAISSKIIDSGAGRVWLELSKDGMRVDDEIIDASGNVSESTWYYEQDVGDVSDVVTLMVHVDEVNQSQTGPFYVIKGIWQISDEVLTIEEGESFGKLVVTAMTGDGIEMELSAPLTLLPGDEYDLLVTSEKLSIKVADSDPLRFNLMKYSRNDFCEIRGSVAGPGTMSWTADSFSRFWYDPDSGQNCESLTLKNATNGSYNEGALNYTSSIAYDIDPEFNFTVKEGPAEMKYDVIAFAGKPYVPLASDNVSKISELLIDDDGRYSLKGSEDLTLAEGYTIRPLVVDVETDMVWLELIRDGSYVDDTIMYANTPDDTWYHTQEVSGEDDVLTLMIHLENVFYGLSYPVWVVDGVWQMSDSALMIDQGDESGKLIVTSNGSGGTIEMENPEPFELIRGSDIDLFEDIKMRTADSPDLRYYPFVSFGAPQCSIDLIYPGPVYEGNSVTFRGQGTDHDGLITASVRESDAYLWESDIDGLLSNASEFTTSSLSPGAHEISLKVRDDEGVWSAAQSAELFVFGPSQAEELLSDEFDEASNFIEWGPGLVWQVNGSDFGGFCLNEDGDGETLVVYENRTAGPRTLDEESVVYRSTAMDGFSPAFPFSLYGPFTYEMIGLFGDLYVPVQGDVSLLSELLVDDNSTHFLTIGKSLVLGEGYSLTPRAIDSSGDKVWIELYRNGIFVDDEVMDVTHSDTWYYEQDIQNEDDVVTLMVHVSDVNKSGNFITIDGLWQISDDPLVIDSDDPFGKMEVTSLLSKSIGMELSEPITLYSNTTCNLAGNLRIKVTGSESLLRFNLVKHDLLNLPPAASIDSMTFHSGINKTTFIGSGFDQQGSTVAYNWTSDIDGPLSTSAHFITSNLSTGHHTICFSVQDNTGAWSDTTSAHIYIGGPTDWNPWNDPDSPYGSLIGTTELQEAINCWVNDLLAPRTGEIVTTQRLQYLIDCWINDSV